MIKEGLVMELKTVQQFFAKSISCLDEADSGFAPKEGLYTVANHVAHKAGIDKVASGPKVRSSYMAHALQGQNLRKTFPA